MPRVSGESRGAGVFSLLINDKRASPESDAFLSVLLQRVGRKTFGYSFSIPSAFVSSFLALLLKKLKTLLFPLHPVDRHPQVRVLFPFQLNLFLFLRIASHSWRHVDRHPHTGTRERTGLFIGRKFLSGEHGISHSLPDFQPWLNLPLEKNIYIPWISVCLFINPLHFSPVLQWVKILPSRNGEGGHLREGD